MEGIRVCIGLPPALPRLVDHDGSVVPPADDAPVPPEVVDVSDDDDSDVEVVDPPASPLPQRLRDVLRNRDVPVRTGRLGGCAYYRVDNNMWVWFLDHRNRRGNPIHKQALAHIAAGSKRVWALSKVLVRCNERGRVIELEVYPAPVWVPSNFRMPPAPLLPFEVWCCGRPRRLTLGGVEDAPAINIKMVYFHPLVIEKDGHKKPKHYRYLLRRLVGAEPRPYPFGYAPPPSADDQVWTEDDLSDSSGDGEHFSPLPEYEPPAYSPVYN